MKRSLLVLALLTACGDKPAPVYQQPVYQQPAQVQQAPAPVIVQAAPQQQSSGMGDLVTGAAIGAVAGHLLTRNSAAPAAPAVTERIIERRTIVKQVAAPVPPPLPAAIVPAAPRLAALPAPAKSYAPAYRATPTVTYRAAPTRR